MAGESIQTGRGPFGLAGAATIPGIADQSGPAPVVLIQGKSFASFALILRSLDDTKANRQSVRNPVRRAHEARLALVVCIAFACKTSPAFLPGGMDACEWRLTVGLLSAFALVGGQHPELLVIQYGQHGACRSRSVHP